MATPNDAIWAASPFQKVWNDALDQYASLLPAEEAVNLRDSKWTHIASLQGLMSTLDHDHEDFETEAGHGSVLTGSLKGLGQGLTVLIGMFGGAAEHAFPPCSQIFGAIAVLVSAGKQVTGAFDALASLFTKMSAFLERLEPLSANQMDPKLQKICIALLVSLLKICALATRRTYHDPDEDDKKNHHPHFSKFVRSFQSKTVEYLTQLVMGEDAEITGAVAELDRLVDAESRITAALTKKDTTEIRAITCDIQGLNLSIKAAAYQIQRDTEGLIIQVTEVAGTLDRIESTMPTKDDLSRQYTQGAETLEGINEIKDILRGRLGKQRQKRTVGSAIAKSRRQAELLQDRLKPPPANENWFNKMVSQRIPGTGDWFLEQPLVKKWLNRESLVLFVSGGRGFGKSFLAGRVVEQLKMNFEDAGVADQKRSFAYFFCKSSLKELSSMADMLRSLAYQIAVEDRVYMNYLDATSRAERLEDDDIKQLWKICFDDFFESGSTSTVLVIDGLDECDDEDFQAILQAVRELSLKDQRWKLRNLQLLLFVKDTSVDTCLDKLSPGLVIDRLLTLGGWETERAENEKDIAKFVDAILENDNDWKRGLVRQKLRDDVHSALLANCQGNFLWTAFVLEEITSLSREDAVRALLADLPKDVSSAMLLVLNRVARKLDAPGREDLNDIIAYVSTAHEYLKVSTLDALLTIRSASSSRVINLKQLLEKNYSTLFILSEYKEDSDTPTEEQIRRRLSTIDRDMTDDGSVDETVLSMDFAAIEKPKVVKNTNDKGGDAFEENLKPLEQLTIRMANDVIEQYNAYVSADHPDESHALSGFGSLDLKVSKMREKVLLRILQAMCDKNERDDPDVLKKALTYGALYLAQHLQDVEVEDVDDGTKLQILKLLLRVLRDEDLIDVWVTYAASSMTNDLLTSSDTRDKILEWFKWPGLVERLDPGEKAWVEKVVETPVEMFHGVAREHAQRWLVKEWNEDEYLTNYEFVHAYMSQADDEKIPDVDKDDTKDDEDDDDDEDNGPFSAKKSSADRIKDVANWAGFERNARFLRRVSVVLRDGNHLDSGVEMAKEATIVGPTSAQAWQMLAMAYWDKAFETSEEADDDPKARPVLRLGTPHMETAVRMFRERAAADTESADQKAKAWQQAQDCQSWLAWFYRYTGPVDKCKANFDELLNGWENETPARNSTQCDAAFWYVVALHYAQREHEAIEVVERIINHPLAQDASFLITYKNFLVDDDTEDWLFEMVCHVQRPDVLDKIWENGIVVLARHGEEGQVAAARWSQAWTMLRLTPDRTEDAIALLKLVLDDEEAGTVANAYNWIIADAELELARIYFQRAITAREHDDWAEVGRNANALFQLARTQSTGGRGEQKTNNIAAAATTMFKTTDAALVLAAWNRVNARPERARLNTRATIVEALETLYDEQGENDGWALTRIADALLAIGQFTRAVEAAQVRASYEVYCDEKDRLVVVAKSIELDRLSENKSGDDEGDDDHTKEDDAKEGAAANDGAGNNDAEDYDAEDDHVKDRDAEDDDESEDDESEDDEEDDDQEDEQEEEQEEDDATESKSPKAEESATNADPTEHVATDKAADRPAENAPQAIELETNAAATDPITNSMPSTDAIAPAASIKDSEQPDTQPDAKESDDDDSGFWWTCDGSCFMNGPKFRPSYHCSYCTADFCDACYDKLIKGKIGSYHMCSPSHEFVCYPPTKRFPKQMVKVEGEFIPMADWLDSIADEWGIPRRVRKDAASVDDGVVGEKTGESKRAIVTEEKDDGEGEVNGEKAVPGEDLAVEEKLTNDEQGAGAENVTSSDKGNTEKKLNNVERVTSHESADGKRSDNAKVMFPARMNAIRRRQGSKVDSLSPVELQQAE